MFTTSTVLNGKMFTTMNNFRDWLQVELNKRHISPAQLARQAGIARSGISMIFNEDRQPGVEVCNAIARALDLDPVSVFRAAGLLPQVDPEAATFEDWKFVLNQLSDKDRDELLEFARLKLKRQEESRARGLKRRPAEG